MIWLFGFVKNVGLAIGDSVVRGANKSFHKGQKQFCGKRKMLFIPEVKYSCGRKGQSSHEFSSTHHWGSNLEKTSLEKVPQAPQGWRERLIYQPGTPSFCLTIEESGSGRSWIYKAGLCSGAAGAAWAYKASRIAIK